jgi:nuclear pore complex protein Nup98-Nup96
LQNIFQLDELAELLDTNGRCIVPTFTIGRKGYGNVYFDEEIDVAGLNLDLICHFRNKEIFLYPDDENKPPVGEGLNRRAQVTLDRIWPKDKVTDELIKDVDRIEAIDYESKLMRICTRKGTKFLEYRPETGSCVFKVDHFSKYTLDDSDEDEDNEPRTDPKKLKVAKPAVTSTKNASAKQGEAVQTDNLTSMQPDSMFFLGHHVGQKTFHSCRYLQNFMLNFIK